MKIKYLIISCIPIFTFTVTFAYIDCRDTTEGCSVEQLLQIGDSALTSKENRISAYKDAIAKINWKIKGLEKEGSNSNEGFDFDKNCKIIKNDLWKGRTDTETNGEVSLLQKFLIENGYLNADSKTGYYGNLTADAVYRYQKEVLKWDWVTLTSGVGSKTRGELSSRLIRMKGVDIRCWN